MPFSQLQAPTSPKGILKLLLQGQKKKKAQRLLLKRGVTGCQQIYQRPTLTLCRHSCLSPSAGSLKVLRARCIIHAGRQPSSKRGARAVLLDVPRFVRRLRFNLSLSFLVSSSVPFPHLSSRTLTLTRPPSASGRSRTAPRRGTSARTTRLCTSTWSSTIRRESRMHWSA